jgi:hypothetical protein
VPHHHERFALRVDHLCHWFHASSCSTLEG